MLLSVTTMTAQSFTGKWKLEKEFFELAERECDGIKVFVTLDISKKNMDVCFLMMAAQDKDGYEMEILLTYPGTYTKKGNRVTATFDYNKAEFKVVDLKVQDPELAEMMSTKEGKESLLALVNVQLKNQKDELLPEMYDVIKSLFSDFTVKDLKAQKLTMQTQEDIELNFLR